MATAAVTAALHYFALAIGFASVVARGNSLRALLRASAVERKEILKGLFLADTIWGIAALLWMVSGLLRAFGGLEKGTAYYLANHLFLFKLGLFLFIFALEIPPMITFIKWRISVKKGHVPVKVDNKTFLQRLWLMNFVECVLVVVIILVASFMARGFGVVQIH